MKKYLTAISAFIVISCMSACSDRPAYCENCNCGNCMPKHIRNRPVSQKDAERIYRKFSDAFEYKDYHAAYAMLGKKPEIPGHPNFMPSTKDSFEKLWASLFENTENADTNYTIGELKGNESEGWSFSFNSSRKSKSQNNSFSSTHTYMLSIARNREGLLCIMGF